MNDSKKMPDPASLGCFNQYAYAESFIFSDGPAKNSRGIRISTGAGLTFVVLPDRGMDIWRAEYRGRTFSWLSPCGPKAPEFLEHGDTAWLRNWPGGLLTGTGLQNVGSPCDYNGEHHTLHGRLSNLPARDISVQHIEDEQGHHIEICGTVCDSAVFGIHLELKRKIRCTAGSNKIQIQDTIRNCGFRATPAQILYHINLGWPLLSENSVLIAPPHEIQARNEEAAAHIRTWDQAEVPQEDFQEQCFYHDIPADADGYAGMSLCNPLENLQFTVRYCKKELPVFTQWKQMGKGEYVMGLEPGTCHPEGLAEEDAKFHNLRILSHGDSFATHLTLEIAEMDC